MRPHFQRLVERARMRPAVPAGFVFPADRDWLQLALSAEFAGFFQPVLIGPEARIRDAASHAGLDISRLAVVNTPDSTVEAARRAVELARTGTVRALVRGSLANEDLLGAVASGGPALRSDRRLSHACYLDLPGRSHGLLVADGLIHIAPTLGAKKDIVRNTVDLAMALGIGQPHVAVLSAGGPSNPAFPSSLDAEALNAMAAQGLFGNAVVDGPLMTDSALSAHVAKAHGLSLTVAGHPDILIAPGSECAALLVRAMTALTGGFAAGVVLGANLPVVLPTRLDSMEARMGGVVLASLYANRDHGQEQTRKPAELTRGAPPLAPHAIAD